MLHRPSTPFRRAVRLYDSPMFVLLKDSSPTPAPNAMKMIMYTTYRSRYHR